MHQFETLSQWLTYIEGIHTQAIDLNLDRVAQVYKRLNINFNAVVITVAGTNGKGSTCALLDSILLQANYATGLYTSPHLLSFNERIKISGQMVSDAALMAAFVLVDAARAEISLSYFEFTTLAALVLFAQAKLDVVILEVGLGGRLDAVNVVDADVAIVTSIDIDHTEYLGNTREEIGFEKAGIFRPEKTAICADPIPPQSLLQRAKDLNVDLWLFGRDFNYSGDKQQWNFAGRAHRRSGLAYPSLRGANQLLNASAALAALEVLRLRVPVSADDVRKGLAMVEHPARFQVLPGRPVVVLDVAHNPHAVAVLAQNLDNMGFHSYTYAVFGAMQDKDICGMVSHIKDKIDHWCLTDLPLPRAASAIDLRECLLKAGVAVTEDTSTKSVENSVTIFANPKEALLNAKKRAGENDRIIVFGSFLTVAGALGA